MIPMFLHFARPDFRASLRTVLGIPVLTCVLAAAGFAAPLSAPLYLDAGTSQSGDSATKLSLASHYDAERGFGWSLAPAEVFQLPASWSTIRQTTLLDGVAGPDFSLQLDLQPGRWTAMVFLDDGFEDVQDMEVALNGTALPLHHRAVGQDAEPGAGPRNRYRVSQITIPAGGSTELRFSKKSGSARLLAVHLLPHNWVANEKTEWIERQLAEVGRFNSRIPLDGLRGELLVNAREPALASFSAYWLAQLELLAAAEAWHDAGGWDWLNLRTRSSMFTRYRISGCLLDALIDHPDGPDFPLRERALWRRTRLVYWLWLEQRRPEDWRTVELDTATMRGLRPDDPLVAMYAGEKIAAPNPSGEQGPLPGAPAWSVAQFEALQRLRQVAAYWIDHRQITNGEMGGKPDDDVEMLRWWPTLIFSGDEKAAAGFDRLAEGIWFNRGMHLGYSREASDVEHSAEFVSDTVPLMALVTRSERWIDRLSWSYRHMSGLWTGYNDFGDRQFKSAWIGATEVRLDPPRNRDLSMNARAAKAVRYFAWLSGEPAVDRLLHEWSSTWAKAAKSSAKGKPAGLFPASIRWPDAAINGDEPSWHRANMFWRYFDWGGDGRLYDQLLFSWVRTGDASLLGPMEATLAFLNKWSDPESRREQAEGSHGWAAERLFASPGFWGSVAQWRLETGDNRFDALLKSHGPPYLRYRLGAGAGILSKAIEESLLDVLRYNLPMRTSEVLFTDRVFVSQNIGNTNGVDLLVAMLTGNHVSSADSPYYHVAWEGASEYLSALVTAANSRSLSADLFIHRKEPTQLTVRLFRLEPGPYRLQLLDGNKVLSEQAVTIPRIDHRVTIDVPTGTLFTLRIARE